MPRIKVLTTEEFDTYFERYKHGDEYALEILLKRNFNLVHHIIAVYFSQVRIEYEDLESIGRYLLYKALKTYDKDKNAKFSTYASVVIYRGLLNEVDKVLRKQPLAYDNALSIYDATYDDVEVLVEETIEDKTSSVVDFLERKEEYQILYELLDKFSKRDQEIIKLFYGLGCQPKTLDELMKVFPLSHSRLGQIVYNEVQRKYQKFYGKQEKQSIKTLQKSEKPMFIWKK